MISATLRRLAAPRLRALRRCAFPRKPGIVLAMALVAVAGTLGAADVHAQAVEFRYQFNEGMDLRYELVQSTSTPLPGMGDMSQEQRQVFRQEVLSVDGEGNARIRQTIESVRMEMNTPMGNQSFDSSVDGQPDDPALAPLAALAGSVTEMVLGPDGSVKDVGDMATWLASMMDEVDAETRAMLESMLSEEALEQMISQSVQGLPPRSLAPGESWEQTVSMPLPFGTLSSTTTYTLEGIEVVEGSQVATLAMVGTMGELEVDPSNPMAGMMSMRGGESSGELRFDLTRGVMLSSTLNTGMRMEMMGQPMTTTSRMEMRLLP